MADPTWGEAFEVDGSDDGEEDAPDPCNEEEVDGSKAV